MSAHTVISHAQNQGGALSKFCPNVYTGCSHSMAMDEDGTGVACVEWCDERGIEWVKRPVPGVSLVKVDMSPTRMIDMSPYFAWKNGESLGEGSWWGIEAQTVEAWIAQATREGRADDADYMRSLLSEGRVCRATVCGGAGRYLRARATRMEDVSGGVVRRAVLVNDLRGLKAELAMRAEFGVSFFSEASYA